MQRCCVFDNILSTLCEMKIKRDIRYKARTSKATFLMALLLFANVLSYPVSLVVFHLNMERNLMECRTERAHGDQCMAKCILKEQLPSQQKAVQEKSVTFLSFFSAFFSTNEVLTITHSLASNISLNKSNRVSIHYQSPGIDKLVPPPKPENVNKI